VGGGLIKELGGKVPTWARKGFDTGGGQDGEKGLIEIMLYEG